jgi:THO complex subunit 2
MSNGPSIPHSSPHISTAGPGQGPRSEASIPSSQDQGRPDLFASRGDPEVDARRPPSQRRDDLPQDRPPPSGRRGDLMEEAAESGRRSTRQSGSSRTDSADVDSPARRGDRGHGGHRDRESYRSDRDGESRDHIRGRERDGDGDEGRDRRGGGGPPDRPAREVSSRNEAQQQPPPTAPQRRSTRRDGPSADIPPNNLPPPPPSSQGGHPPPAHDDRGGGRRAYPSGPSGLRGDDRDQRGGERDMRERGPTRDNHSHNRGPRDSGDLPPRKHPRAEEGAPYGGGGGGRGGSRMASESKRPRRGG